MHVFSKLSVLLSTAALALAAELVSLPLLQPNKKQRSLKLMGCFSSLNITAADIIKNI